MSHFSFSLSLFFSFSLFPLNQTYYKYIYFSFNISIKKNRKIKQENFELHFNGEEGGGSFPSQIHNQSLIAKEWKKLKSIKRLKSTSWELPSYNVFANEYMPNFSRGANVPSSNVQWNPKSFCFCPPFFGDRMTESEVHCASIIWGKLSKWPREHDEVEPWSVFVNSN